MPCLRPLTDEDRAVIRRWPSYPDDMAQMDYAVRENGWLDEFRSRPDACIYAVYEGTELIGFTLLARTGADEAEVRIAIRPDRTGRGLGGDIMGQTLRTGFQTLGLSRIHLIVRTNNLRGIRLYRRLGFVEQGAVRKAIQGVMVEFIRMGLDRADFGQPGETGIKEKTI